MDKKSLISQHFNHPRLGHISLTVKSTARCISARWSSGILKVTVPPGTTSVYLMKALDELEQRLLSKRPAMRHYTAGWTYTTPEFTFEVVCGDHPTKFKFKVFQYENRGVFYLPASVADTGSDVVDEVIQRTFNDYAHDYSYFIMNQAEAIKKELGVQPRSISISHGQKLLGRCSSKGEISLSRNLVFYPLEVRRYVIAHEFAHLQYMNHGAEFHALLNKYLAGREAELSRLCRTHPLPFLK